MKIPENAIALKIDFKKGSESPERVFDTMSALIKATQKLDNCLLRAIDGSVKPVLLLEDIETGSLVSIVRNVLKNTDDDSLKSGDWKKVVGNYLFTAKHAFLKNYPEEIGQVDKLKLLSIQKEIAKSAMDTGADKLPFYSPPPINDLLDKITDYNEAVIKLSSDESASFLGKDGTKVPINKITAFNKSAALETLKERELSNDIQVMLAVKKPDYLGRSQWSFVYDGKSIDASITHESWLIKFQNREVDVRPGDSLYVNIRVTTTYGSGSTILATKYNVTEVIQVDKNPPENHLIS